jgi:hypothetical protein
VYPSTLTHSQLQAALEPQEGAAAARAALASQGKELLGSHSALLAAKRVASERESGLRVLQQEVWELKQRAARQGQLLAAFAGELSHAMGLSDERPAGGRSERGRALDALAANYCAR